MQRFVITLLLAGLPALAAAAVYQPRLSEAEWQSVPGSNACHLVHRLPRLGTVILSQYRDHRLVTTLVTRRPPAGRREGRLYREATPWQPPVREVLARVDAVPERNALRFDHDVSALLLEGLEAGREMRLAFPAWQAGPLDAVLSPVAFRPALRAHLSCLGDGDGPAPDDGDAAGGAAPGNRASAAAAAGAAGRASVSAGGGDLAAPGEDGRTPIYFGRGTARLDRTDFERIRALARRLRGAGHLSEVVIVGHTDSTGSAGYNRALGLARAIEVRNHLIAEGVAADRLAVRSHGEARPVTDNGDRFERSRNRRVVIETRL